MKATTLIATISILFLSACATVPESVKEANDNRLNAVREMFADALKAKEDPIADITITLPPGNFTVPEGGWELATIKVREGVDVITLAALDATDWQIPENVAITGLRVLAPLAGFAIGQHYTYLGSKVVAGAMTTAMASNEAITTRALDNSMTTQGMLVNQGE